MQIGLRYRSLSEDYYTGYRLQCDGWKSVLCHPDRPAFLGDIPITLIDVLNQNKRWSVGPLDVTISKYCPLTYGVSKIGFLMAYGYAYNAFWSSLSIPITVYAFLPQLALLARVSIFPKVRNALYRHTFATENTRIYQFRIFFFPYQQHLISITCCRRQIYGFAFTFSCFLGPMDKTASTALHMVAHFRGGGMNKECG